MGADSSKSAYSTLPGGGDVRDNATYSRRPPPIATRSQSVPLHNAVGIEDDEFGDTVPKRKESLQRHRSSMVVVNQGQDYSTSAAISQDPLMKKLEELHFFYPLMHDVEKRSGLFGTHNKRALADIQSKIQSLPALKIVRMYESRLKDHAETISVRQGDLTNQIRDTDQMVNVMLKSYSERAKTTVRYVDRLSKMDDLKKNLSKCQETLNECVAIIDLLNVMLPETERLEEFSPWVDEQASECVDNT